MELNNKQIKTPLRADPQLNNGTTDREIQQNIEALYKRINEVNRQLQYWDLYHINYVAYNEQEFVSYAATLPIGESLLNNSDDIFYYNNQLITRGGVLVHTIDDKKVYVKPNTNGYFYPDIARIHEGQITFEYKYTESGHKDDVSFSVPATNTNHGYYGDWYKIENPTSYFKTNTNWVGSWIKKPMIRFFHLENNKYEEISLEYNYYSYDDKLSIEFIDDDIPVPMYVLIK